MAAAQDTFLTQTDPSEFEAAAPSSLLPLPPTLPNHQAAIWSVPEGHVTPLIKDGHSMAPALQSCSSGPGH